MVLMCRLYCSINISGAEERRSPLCFIFSVLFLSGTIPFPLFYFRIKEKLAFLAVHRLISRTKISEIKQFAKKEKKQKSIDLTIISRTEECVPPPHKFKFLCEWLFCLDTFCSLVFKALSLSSLVRLSRLLNGCGVLQPLLLLCQLYLLNLPFPFLVTFSVFHYRGQRVRPPCFTVLELCVIS